MVDHRRDAGRRAAGGVHPDARRARLEDALQPIGAAVAATAWHAHRDPRHARAAADSSSTMISISR